MLIESSIILSDDEIELINIPNHKKISKERKVYKTIMPDRFWHQADDRFTAPSTPVFLPLAKCGIQLRLNLTPCALKKVGHTGKSK